MNGYVILGFAGAGAAVVSGVLWLLSAKVNVTTGVMYLDGPPKNERDKLKWQARYNTGAAFFAAIAALCQAAYFYGTLPPPPV